MTVGIGIIGHGRAAPDRRVANAELEARFGLPDGWIVKRSGIEARRYAADDQAVSDLALVAAEQALNRAGVEKREVALLLLATSTPDHLLPPTAPLVAHRLGLARAGSIDMAGACAGFIYALAFGAGFAAAQKAPVLVVAANILSRRTNDQDRNTSILFSDAAGAVLLGPSSRLESGLIGLHLTSEGAAYGMIQIPGGGSRTPFKRVTDATQTLMVLEDGRTVFAKAVAMMVDAAQKALAQAGIDVGDIDHFIPHQANMRMMKAVAEKLGVSETRIRSTIAEYGNSSAATIPFTLSASFDSEPMQQGQIVLMTAAGAGLTGGAAVFRL